MAPPCRLIQNQLTTIVVPVFDWQLILMESRPWSPGTWGCHHPFVGELLVFLWILLDFLGILDSALAGGCSRVQDPTRNPTKNPGKTPHHWDLGAPWSPPTAVTKD